jgi:hypothetical protein
VTVAPAAAPAVLGRTEPRLFTPPLVELSPATSYGYAVIDFAREVLGTPLDPWQQWLVVHAGELLPDGLPRFRYVLVLVARQQGKTTLCQVLTLFWLYVEGRPLVLGTSTNRDYAKAAWLDTIDRALAVEDLAADVPRGGVRKANGQEAFVVAPAGEPGQPAPRPRRYVIAASNRKGGRSLTVHRLILDELREHHTFDAWNAATNAMNAVPSAQCWAITNQGDDAAVVLDALRTPSVAALERPVPDDDVGLFEWSAPMGSSPTDLAALAYANPSLGLPNRTSARALLGQARRAAAAGGDELAGFRTEVMCQRVPRLDPALSPERWAACATETPRSLADQRRRVALCVDVSLDESHATLVAAAVVGDVVHVEVVAQWSGELCTVELRRALPDIVRKVRPRKLGWFPHGPAAAVAARIADKGSRSWPPRGVDVAALDGVELPAVCMGLAEQVKAGEVQHADDPMLNAHVEGAQKLRRSEGQWVFTRKGAGPIDGAYALAGAVHLARTIPPPPAPLSVA